VADLRDNFSAERKFLGVNGSDYAVDGQIIRTAALPLIPFQIQNAAALSNRRRAEIIPANPLQRKPVPAEQQRFRSRVVNDGSFLR
jgi:hypothetical protein